MTPIQFPNLVNPPIKKEKNWTQREKELDRAHKTRERTRCLIYWNQIVLMPYILKELEKEHNALEHNVDIALP